MNREEAKTYIKKIIYIFVVLFVIWLIIYKIIPKNSILIRNSWLLFGLSFIPGFLVGIINNFITLNVLHPSKAVMEYIFPGQENLDEIMSTTIATSITAFISVGLFMVVKKLFKIDPYEHPLIESVGIIFGGFTMALIYYYFIEKNIKIN
jgi:hypothetical protein